MPDLFTAYPTIPAPETCRCGYDRIAVTPGKGPHAAALRCPNCDRFYRWLSKVEYEAFLVGEDH